MNRKTDDRAQIRVFFKSKIEKRYREDLEQLFFFNKHQKKYAAKITESVSRYAKPVIFEHEDGRHISLEFKDRKLGQTWHIFDDQTEDASLIGVLMFVREQENPEQITIVHLALHDTCVALFKQEDLNIARIIFKKALRHFRKIKQINTVHFFYSGKNVRVGESKRLK